jgi:hypothetical protein
MNTIFFNRVTTAPAAGSSRTGTEILVFKTNLTDSRRVNDVEPLLDVHPNIVQWNVDLEDCDNVLRIVGRNMAAQEVEDMLLHAGYYCEELQ